MTTQLLGDDPTPDERAGVGVADFDTIGPYRVLQQLGQGGMGIVHLAQQHLFLHALLSREFLYASRILFGWEGHVLAFLFLSCGKVPVSLGRLFNQ